MEKWQERRLSELSTTVRDLTKALEVHRVDAYAHGAMIGRIMQENITLRERYENRMKDSERRLALLETFKGQVLLMGSIGYLLLGLALAGLAQRIFHISM